TVYCLLRSLVEHSCINPKSPAFGYLDEKSIDTGLMKFLGLCPSALSCSQQLLFIHMIMSPSMGLTGTCTGTSSSIVHSPHMLMTKAFIQCKLQCTHEDPPLRYHDIHSNPEPFFLLEIVYPCIPDPDGEDEGGQASSSPAVST
ncbi:hypothetical protein BHM03_00047359, partial [Ensete ventricosum]